MEAPPPVNVAAAWHDLGERLRVYVARRVDPGDADDIVQSVMVKLLERRAEIGPESVRAWLFAVTRNAVAEYYRQRRPSIDVDTIDLASSEEVNDTIGALSDCLDPVLRMLPDTDADVLRRVDLEGEAQTELAAKLGVPLSTLKSRVQRARTKLRAAFDACCAIHVARDGAPVAVDCAPRCGPRE